MTRREPPRMSKNRKARPIAGIVPPSFEIVGQSLTGRRDLGDAPADNMRAEQRRGGLSQRAGANLLTKLRHSPGFVGHDVQDDPAAANR